MNSIEPASLEIENPENLNGIYSNKPEGVINDEYGEDLNKLLFRPYHKYRWKEEINFDGHIEIKILTNKKLKISYFENHNLVSSKILKGKFKNGFFLVRRKIRPIGIPFIFFLYRERRIMLGINKEEQLIVKTSIYDAGMVLIASAGGQGVSKYIFAKEK